MPCHITQVSTGITYCGLTVGGAQWDNVEDAEVRDDLPRDTILSRVSCEPCRAGYSGSYPSRTNRTHFLGMSLRPMSLDASTEVISWQDVRELNLRLEALEAKVEQLKALMGKQREYISHLTAGLFCAAYGDITTKQTSFLARSLSESRALYPIVECSAPDNWQIHVRSEVPQSPGPTVWDKIGADDE